MRYQAHCKEQLIMKRISLLLLLGICSSVFAATSLSGSIGGVTFSASGNPFIVKDNLTILKDKEVIIEKGCIFLFDSFSGLVIDGTLLVEGTNEDPVVFTSINDTIYNKKTNIIANPFDWNGILITQNAEKVKLSNFQLKYSVYGLKSQKETLQISHGSFAHNGQFHFTVKDEIVPVTESIPVNFGTKPGEKSSRKMSGKKVKTITTIALGVATVATLSLATVQYAQAQKANDLYLNAQPVDGEEPNYDLLLQDYKTKQRNSMITAGAGSAGLICRLWLLIKFVLSGQFRALKARLILCVKISIKYLRLF